MMTISLENVNLKDLCIELFNMFNPLVEEKKVKLNFKSNEDIKIDIYTDKEKIKQILKNFLSNALKFTNANGSIIILLDSNMEDNDKLPIKISIEDTGIGIAEEKLETIFEAFKQVDGSTSRKYGGTGLGLSISKELTKILGGEIIVESTKDKGSVFTLLLPNEINTLNINKDLIDVIHSNNKTEQSLIPKQLFLSFLGDDRNNIKVEDKVLLIIEDDLNFANIVKDEAKKFNLKTILTVDGTEGLLLAEKYQPLGIILDINLPILDGWSILKSLKSNVKTRHIPVKIISGDIPIIEAKKMGAVNFIQKPIELETLESTIQNLISKNIKEKDLLIVEDNDILRENLIEMLKNDDVNIIAVSTGMDAINAVKSTIFDCAIIDIGLPDMTGFKLLKTIKKLNCTLPVIVYSGRDFTKEELKVLREFSESIVIKTAESEARLIDETSLFLHRLHENFTSNQKQILNNLFDYNDIFINKKVLIVDDDVRNVFALDSLLVEKGFIINSAYNGEEALLELEKNHIDIILMDIMMPVMNGYETIENIKKDIRFRDIPIIALTAKAQKEDKQKCLDVGASDYITKPINEEQLLQLMKILIKTNDCKY